MTTKQPGGRISGALTLTGEAQEALAIGDPVQMVTAENYEFEKCDGTRACVGHVITSNVKRTSSATVGQYPVANVPGDVAVEARGVAVQTFVAGGAIDAGEEVGWNATSELVEAGVGVATVGIALTTAAEDEDVDVLIR